MLYRVDIENKKLIEIPVTSFSELSLRERFFGNLRGSP